MEGAEMKKFLKQLHQVEKGFTLIELLVVIAILGVVVAAAIPNVSKFIGTGEPEAYGNELHNIKTGLIAMLSESALEQLDAAVAATADMDDVVATQSAAGDLILSDYLTGLNADGTVKSGCTYSFTIEGDITQTTP